MFTWKRGFLNVMFAPDGVVGGGASVPGESVGGLIPTKPAADAANVGTGGAGSSSTGSTDGNAARAAAATDTTPAKAGGDRALDNLPEDVQSYIRDLRKEAETYRKERKLAVDAASLAENKRLEEQGKYKELYEKTAAEIAAAKQGEDRVKELEAAFNTTLEARIAAVPKEFQGLIPRQLSPVQLSAWLDANAGVLTTRMAPKLDAGASSVTGQPYAGSQDHLKKVAQRYNIAIKGGNTG